MLSNFIWSVQVQELPGPQNNYHPIFSLNWYFGVSVSKKLNDNFFDTWNILDLDQCYFFPVRVVSKYSAYSNQKLWTKYQIQTNWL